MAFFEKNQQVKTPLGYGKVAFQRMKAPDYTEVEAVSVILNDRAEQAKAKGESYTGTMFSAEVVKVATPF